MTIVTVIMCMENLAIFFKGVHFNGLGHSVEYFEIAAIEKWKRNFYEEIIFLD